jgi:hypothetical protein
MPRLFAKQDQVCPIHNSADVTKWAAEATALPVCLLLDSQPGAFSRMHHCGDPSEGSLPEVPSRTHHQGASSKQASRRSAPAYAQKGTGSHALAGDSSRLSLGGGGGVSFCRLPAVASARRPRGASAEKLDMRPPVDSVGLRRRASCAASRKRSAGDSRCDGVASRDADPSRSSLQPHAARFGQSQARRVSQQRRRWLPMNLGGTERATAPCGAPLSDVLFACRQLNSWTSTRHRVGKSAPSPS